jgi:hypothetical protein
VRAAKAFGNAAPQNSIVNDLLPAFLIPEPQSEDCLYLNIWTPRTDAARRPVLVWIHGGAFTLGSGAQSLYDGGPLAKRGDVVVVTINYRLGALGFLRLQELTGGRIPPPATRACDQLAALAWVRENIAAFGGDPENVTIFGESAGGMSVGTLLGLPKARGLFHKAIPQSGACSTANTRERAVKIAEHYAAKLGAGRSADALRAASTAEILQAQAALAPPPGAVVDREVGGMPMQPVVDGEVQPRLALESLARGSAAGVPVLVGSTLEEWKLFMPADPSNFTLTEETVLVRCERRMGPGARSVVESYRKARSERGDPVTGPEIWSRRDGPIFRMLACPARPARARGPRLQLPVQLALADDGRGDRRLPRARAGLRVRLVQRPGHGRLLGQRARGRRALGTHDGRVARLREERRPRLGALHRRESRDRDLRRAQRDRARALRGGAPRVGRRSSLGAGRDLSAAWPTRRSRSRSNAGAPASP